MLRRHPRELRVRHLAAPLLVAGLIASAGAALAGAAGALTLPMAYAGVLLVGSAAVGAMRGSTAALLLPAVLALMHVSWGIGFFMPDRRGLALPRHPEAASEAPAKGQPAEWNAPSAAP